MDDVDSIAIRDTLDSTKFYSATPIATRRPDAKTATARSEEYYNMSHPRRGDCHIFVYQNYASSTIPTRDSAEIDKDACVEAFGSAKFNVEVHRNYTKEQFLQTISAISRADHSECDALAIVFMSHGDERNGREILHLYDGTVPTDTLWQSFLGNECTSLAGKPKLFFIQACRGDKVDYGVGLRVVTDSTVKQNEMNYSIPAHADLLVMWASFKGMFAFKTMRNDIRGSVFIHFLTQCIMNDCTENQRSTLQEILLKVTREVAIEFESITNDDRLTNNKQVPHLSSTLMRKIIF